MIRITKPMPRVLIIEPEQVVRSVIESSLTKSGFEVVHVGNCVQPDASHNCALQCYSGEHPPDVVIAAVISPRLCSGIEVAAKALLLWRGAKALLISATPCGLWPDDARDLLDTLPATMYRFLAKPFTSEMLTSAVSALTSSPAQEARDNESVGTSLGSSANVACASFLNNY